MVSVAGFRTSETPSARSIFLGDAVFEKESLFQNLQILPVKAKPVLAWVEHEVSKSKGKQVGESKGQDIKPMARDRNSRNWIYFLAVKCYPVAQGSFDHQCREMGTSEMELSRTVQVSTGDEMNCHVLGHFFFSISLRERIQQLLHIFKLQNNSIHKPMLQQYANYFSPFSSYC